MPTTGPSPKPGRSWLFFRDPFSELASLLLTSEIRIKVLVREAQCFEMREFANTDSQVKGHYFKLPLDPCTIYQLMLET